MPTTLVNVCFHGIGAPARELEPGEADYWISEAAFTEILDVVAPDPRVRISFDDANASDLRVGLPELQRRGLSATFFVLAGRLDTPGSLGTGEVRTLRDAGMRIGTHGMHHVPWRRLGATERETELVRAREHIAEVVGGPVDVAALPLGRYDRDLLGHLRRLGYREVHTSDRRWGAEGRWLQPRFSARTGDDGASFVRDVLTAAPWHRRLRRQAVGVAKRLR